jgi:hypothetical protein
VIRSRKTYFGLRETERVRYLDGDGRVYLNRNKELYDLIVVDAFQGGYVPFHLLTKEFYTLVKQRLAPGGAAAFNVHDGTKLYHSTVKTLGEVFPTLDLYPSGQGEVIVVVTDTAPDKACSTRAAALQQQYNFRFPLPSLLERRSTIRARRRRAAWSSPTISRRSILRHDRARPQPQEVRPDSNGASRAWRFSLTAIDRERDSQRQVINSAEAAPGWRVAHNALILMTSI